MIHLLKNKSASGKWCYGY